MPETGPSPLLALGDAIAAATALPSLDPRYPLPSLPVVAADLPVVLDLAQRAGQALADVAGQVPSTKDLPELLRAIASCAHVSELLSTAGAHLSQAAAVMTVPSSQRPEDGIPTGVLAALARACIDDAAQLASHHDTLNPTDATQLRTVAATQRSPALPGFAPAGHRPPAPAPERAATVLPFRRRTH
ncbi:hypothetical protein [Streptacidiphilus jiangxiensis]|uniref:Uncharacterized protein n=1 Tax=Streptacidiphilus jiangxiensis TaxID=235985 RepID=A0A1H8A4H6_STRJI|nr:hypothetical protein [Streptacidiphilus jiangxiensis]SEM65655.1 hypothetical protein SAMN05414137_1419 [Streptacidiphilus jiangxiensis]